jgi:hypothetical protein
MQIKVLFAILLISTSLARNPERPIKRNLGQPSDFAVTSVPGFEGTIPFKNYAGYLPANDGGKQLFFWLIDCPGLFFSSKF